MVQSNSYMVRMALDLDMKTVLNPVVHLKYDVETLALELAGQLKAKLSAPLNLIREALYYAKGRQEQFQRAVLNQGSEICGIAPSRGTPGRRDRPAL